MRFFHNLCSRLTLIITFVRTIFPAVNMELQYWANQAKAIPCPELKEQALASLQHKKFHCQGGSIYSLYKGVNSTDFIPFVVALQTISDYLDNLCDRVNIADEQAFQQLHLAVSDALDPEAIHKDYYAYYPCKEDGGYLTSLVNTCQQQLKKLPSFPLVKEELSKLASLYSSLQTYKHLALSIREKKMSDWMEKANHEPHITHWEFAAATGSTLGMFMLCASASDKHLTPNTVSNIYKAYFPWISGLHILLDYFIDAAEDKASGDLNFVAYYTDDAQTLSRLTLFTKNALLKAASLPQPHFHKTVVHGLLAMYLSDSKANAPQEQIIRKALLKSAGSYTLFLYFLCKFLRSTKKL